MPRRPPPRRISTLLIFSTFIGIFALLTLLWQHAHIQQTDISSLLAYSKNAFITSSVVRGLYREGSVQPIDLTVNFLGLIDKAPGAPAEPIMASSASSRRVSEDFLPVAIGRDIKFRWRHVAVTGANMDDLVVTAYQVVVKSVGRGDTVWDSGKIDVDEEKVVRHVEFGGEAPTVGQILQWQVTLWDKQQASSASEWSKFAVGPEDDNEWKAKWIVHPSDLMSFDRSTEVGKLNECERWETRRPLPLFRTKLSLDKKNEIASALLLVSGLGSFRASVNGVPLSTSGPIDPPFTDYSKRVMYRGFDVTPFTQDPEMVIGMNMGSGWWDHRPVSGMAKPELLPRGPQTIIAQLVVTYKSGESVIVGETGDNEQWQVTRGHIRESDLFTGEMIDLDVLTTMEGWDTAEGWKDTTTLDTSNTDPYKQINQWLNTALYVTDVTLEQRVQNIAIKAKAMERGDSKAFPQPQKYADPIGKLVPHEIPPVMSMERIAPDEIHDLGSGRWLFDFSKAFSGMLHFDEGLPEPIIPDTYPRAHGFKAASANGDSFITVIYGESLEMTTGDINRVLVAGLGLHDGGPRHVSKAKGATKHTFCFPDDHDDILSQRDVYVIPKASSVGKSAYAKARQSHFTTHAFRFAEICCTKEPPKGVSALLYRTAVPEWGNFDSSNVLINGGYELIKNAMISNIISVQSDCPHREKLPYGGDLVADSPAALHFFDMSSFYKKTVYDWLDAQWSNGAYTETSVWQDLNDYAGIGHGAGETVWASAPPVLTVRHYQNYADDDLLKKSLPHHARWLKFLDKFFDTEMTAKGYAPDLKGYTGEGSGLGDWLGLRGRDTWLTHTGFYMASARAVAYIAHAIGDTKRKNMGLDKAKEIRDRIATLYLKNGKDNFDAPEGHEGSSPGPEMSLFSRIVPGDKRCIVLKNWFKRGGHTWPGDEEKLFLSELKNQTLIEEMVQRGELVKFGENEYSYGWSQWEGFNEGIFAIRYGMKTLSEMGFHNIALRKASGFGFGSTEYMMSFNATTMWESFWRSEDLYSRNHPMLGALAEWMPSSAAGVSLAPTTIGGNEALFWPRFPKSASTISYASAEQGSTRGDYAIAWKFVGLPADKSKYDSAIVSIRVRILIPPTAKGILRLPISPSSKTTATLRSVQVLPDLHYARSAAKEQCRARRRSKLGFNYNWDYDRSKKEWFKRYNGKAIGTPCESFLFYQFSEKIEWGNEQSITENMQNRLDLSLAPGLHEVVFKGWPLEKEIEGKGHHGSRLGNIPAIYDSSDVGPYCSDSSEADWNIEDGTHFI